MVMLFLCRIGALRFLVFLFHLSGRIEGDSFPFQFLNVFLRIGFHRSYAPLTTHIYALSIMVHVKRLVYFAAHHRTNCLNSCYGDATVFKPFNIRGRILLDLVEARRAASEDPLSLAVNIEILINRTPMTGQFV
ncbi:MAG: hypothetical protein ACUVWX_10840 [Kiritimatiellia bacterium]